MEKYIVTLIILGMLVFCLCTFPVFSNTMDQMYLIISDDFVADKILFKIDNCENELAKRIPQGKIIKEYTFLNQHNIKTDNPFMQCILSGKQWVCGLPYVVD